MLPVTAKHKIISLLVVLILGSCGKQNDTAGEPTPEETARVQEIGKQAAQNLMETLKGELTGAIQAGGPVSAIEVCSRKALDLTSGIAASSDNVFEVKRTSFKYRNPQNAPDELEEKALQLYESAAAKGEELPPYHIQKISKDPAVFRYYQPMKTGGLCLTCHGDKSAMPQEVIAQLNQTYPEDKATGYQAGDFRGLIRVTIDLPQ